MNIPHQASYWTLFSSGFRLFFIAAASLSSLAISYWLLLFLGLVPATDLNYYPPLIWHMHEMVYGYAGAVIAGFLLTAVSAWTGLATLRGWPLAILFTIWLGARCLPFLGTDFVWLVALLNPLFFIYLGFGIAIPIIKSGNNRNLFVVVITLVLAISNASLHANLLGFFNSPMIANTAIAIAFYLQLLLIIIIAGRVFPMFSANGLQGIYSPKKYQWLEIACVLSFLMFAIANIIDQSGQKLAPFILLLLALLVVTLHSLRVAYWFHWRIWTKPLIWVLHAGYYFLIVGVLLIGLSAYYPEARVSGLHAMLAGGLGLITLGMMARVSIGHTGRDIQQPNKLIVLVFILVAVATLIRAFLPLVDPELYLLAIKLSGVLWSVGFLLFIALYLPALVTRRVDGAAG
ncbi:MAG: NnrS family protein [Arenicella sp.]|nr:NnrS family protein [Arenicella sp.]